MVIRKHKVNAMKVKHMTKEQCERIMANNYLGEHDKKGKQKDYSDYEQEIKEHYWDMKNKEMEEKVWNFYL